MSKARAFILLALALIVGGAILLVITSPREPISSQQTQAQKVNLRGYNEEGVLSWSLEALEGVIKNDTGTLTTVEAVFYEEGTERLQATADTLTFAGKEATLNGGVEVLHEDYRLKTEALAWHETEGVFTAEDVTIFFEAANVEAEAFQYDLKKERVVLEGGIIATLARTRTLQVVGERAEKTNGRLILTGGVSVEGKDESYQCASLKYNLEGEEVNLSGGVEGRFNTGTIRAGSITLTSRGTAACGNVILQLDSPFFQEADDA